MIADLDETIKKLLSTEIPIRNGEIDVKFDQPKREWSARIQKPTVNFYLYDVRENPTLRRHQWESVKPTNGNGLRDVQAIRKRTPFRVDCFYMITAWAAEPEDEHRLLTRCLLSLFRHPIIPDKFLVGTMQNPPYDIQAKVANHDKLTNPAEVWSALDNEMRPSVSYIVTIALDPWTEVTGPVVRTFSLTAGQANDLPQNQSIVPGGLASEMHVLGGTIRGKDGKPQPGIEVAIKGTGLFATTNADGRYVLGAVPPGDYTLVVWNDDGKPKEKKITFPTKEVQFDFEI